MSPRPYNLGKRHEQVDQSRRQVLSAARALLGDSSGYTAFTVDAVAKGADVARGTVYYQFKSKTGLLEAVCDDLADSGGLINLVTAFTNPDPAGALAAFIDCFGRFWQADRPAMRRLRALAALDPEVHAVISARDQRRLEGLETLMDRFPKPPRARGGPAARHRKVRTLLAVTSFETFDVLAGPDQDLVAVVPQVVELSLAVINPRGSPGVSVGDLG
jgi:AcrR family transcriptional regulator